jgi:hypothetical protein
MCSIVNLRQMLREMKRVLKRDGQLLFIEHGLSPDPRVQKWQNRIAPIWSRASGGCCVNKKIDDSICGSGFTLTELANLYIPGPRLWSTFIKDLPGTNSIQALSGTKQPFRLIAIGNDC